jgi:ketosteroid isomerase-like protein
MLPLVIVICSTTLSFGCRPQIDLEQERATLLQTDRDCAAASVEVGFAAAYYRYLAEDAIVMPPGQNALSGREDIYARWREGAGDVVLEWEPKDGSVSQAGDLGWTWGNWVLIAGDEAGQSQRSYGKYVFIWKRVGGDWRIVANIWNDSPAPG